MLTCHNKAGYTERPTEPGYQTPPGGGLAMGVDPVSCQSAACLLHAWRPPVGVGLASWMLFAVIGERQSLTALGG